MCSRRNTSVTSPSSLPSTLSLPSMLLRRSGMHSRTSQPRHLNSPSPRPLLALLHSTTNIAESMLVTGIHTRTLLPFSITSSRNTTEFLPAPSTLLTWMLEKLRVTLLKMSQSTLAEFVLVAPLMDLVFPPESPRNNVLELKSLWLRLSRASLLTLLVNTTHLLVWRETGPRAVVSSTMTRRPSLSGSMKKISSVSSLCRWEETSEVSLKDLPRESRLLETQSRKNLARTSAWMPSTDTFTLAQPILVLVREHPSTLTFPDGPSTALMNLRLDVRSSISSPVEPVENLVAKLASPMTSPTSTDWDTLRSNWSRR